jgi:hypothetical protein
MADLVFNIAKGRIAHYASLPAANDALIVVLFKSAGLGSDAVLRDLTTLTAVKANATEADFTGYVRKTATASPPAVDNTNDWVACDFADLTWTAAGGATNNTLGKAVVCYDPDTTTGTDADLIPLTAHDYAVTTTGSDLVLTVAAGGFARAG